MKARKIFFFIFLTLTVAVEVFILVQSAFNGSRSTEESSRFTELVVNFVKLFNVNADIVLHPENYQGLIRKLFGHFFLFGGLGTFGMLTMSMLENAYKTKKMQIILSSIAFGLSSAIISELIQLFVPGRAGAITDIFIDFGGYALFSFAIFVILFIINNIKEKKNVSTLGQTSS